MKFIDGLNIERELLPLFDFTVNSFAREKLFSLFREPLSCVTDILERQSIIKGFVKHQMVLANYSYSKPDFYEVYSFLCEQNMGDYARRFNVGFGLSKKVITRIQPTLIQVVTLLGEIEQYYIKNIDIGFFPEAYRLELIKLHDFLASFHLQNYTEKVKENQFGKRQSVELAKIIAEKQANDEIQAFFHRFAVFEAYVSISKAVTKHGFCFPLFVESALSFEGVYHPILTSPVKNDLSSDRNVLLLTGPNMSGKSTFLKATGICVYLAHLGIAVPATKVQMPFYDLISIAINHHDDILNGYSHFMTEIMRLKEVVMQARKGMKCFAIFDELFKGTNMDDAVQISAVTISGLLQFSTSFFFISTHLNQMRFVNAVAEHKIDTYYLDCTVNEGIPVFAYRVKAGWSDLRIGQLLFEKAGLNDLLKKEDN